MNKRLLIPIFLFLLRDFEEQKKSEFYRRSFFFPLVNAYNVFLVCLYFFLSCSCEQFNSRPERAFYIPRPNFFVFFFIKTTTQSSAGRDSLIRERIIITNCFLKEKNHLKKKMVVLLPCGNNFYPHFFSLHFSLMLLYSLKKEENDWKENRTSFSISFVAEKKSILFFAL